MDEIIIFICLIILIIIGFLFKFNKIEKIIAEQDKNSIQGKYKIKNYIGSRILFIAEIGLFSLLFSIIFNHMKFYLITSWSIISFIIVLQTISTVEKFFK